MSATKKGKVEAEEVVTVKITLDEVLKKKGITGYKFAKEHLKAQPNALTPIRKEGYDPKLSTLVRWAKILDCDVNDLFEADGYAPKSPVAAPVAAEVKESKQKKKQ